MIYFRPEINGNTAVINAVDGESVSGSCKVSVNSYECVLSDITAVGNDGLLAEGLIRSALNFAANRGAYIAKCSQSEFDGVLKALGFSLEGGEYSGEIPELLKGSCCKNK